MNPPNSSEEPKFCCTDFANYILFGECPEINHFEDHRMDAFHFNKAELRKGDVIEIYCSAENEARRLVLHKTFLDEQGLVRLH